MQSGHLVTLYRDDSMSVECRGARQLHACAAPGAQLSEFRVITLIEVAVTNASPGQRGELTRLQL